MNGYSEDLRQRVVRAAAGGMSQADAARVFAVSDRTIRRYLRRQRETGAVAATRQRHGPRPVIGPGDHAALVAQLTAHPDATLVEHCERWAGATGRRVSTATMCRAMQRVRWTVKKSR